MMIGGQLTHSLLLITLTRSSSSVLGHIGLLDYSSRETIKYFVSISARLLMAD